jgi:hypothetical protein
MACGLRRFLARCTQEALIWACIDSLVRHAWWNVNKIARPSFVAKFQLVAPAHSNSALNGVENPHFYWAAQRYPPRVAHRSRYL